MIDIPRLAYIEAQIIHRAAKAGALAPFVREVELEYKVHKGALGSGVFIETRILGLLYALILVPKELWELKSNHRIYARLETNFSLDGVDISLDRSSFTGELYKFIHHLRNALAHARFRFEGESFEFWDGNLKEEKYRACITSPMLVSFLEIVGSNLANYGSWPDTVEGGE